MRSPLGAAPPLGVILLAAALVAAVTPWIAYRLAAGRDDADAGSYRPPAHVTRLRWEPIAGAELADAGAFTRVGDRLALLDRRAKRVHFLERQGTGWRVVASAGRPGRGPGELSRPVAIAALPHDAGVAVLEADGRLLRFAPDGATLGAERWSLPCAMREPALALAPHRRLLAGACFDPTRSRDTVFTHLWSADGGERAFRELARRPRLAADLSWGTIFAAPLPLADGDSIALFGTGLEPCVMLVRKDDASRTERCALVSVALDAPPPEHFLRDRAAARRAGGPRAAPAFGWPRPLPPFFGALQVGDSLRLLRAISGDSVVLTAAPAPAGMVAPLAVAPLDHFVGCTRGACLWVDVERSRLMVIDGSNHQRTAIAR